MITYQIENKTLVIIDGELYEKINPSVAQASVPARTAVRTPKSAVFESIAPQPKRGFTEAEKENIYELTRRGEKPKAISKIFKCTPVKISMVLMFARKNGVNLEPNQDQPSFEE